MTPDQDGSLEAFKAQIPIVDIVSRHVKLTKRGREHVGLCPFHKEKTPSFTVVEDKGFFHCFGCQAHGNAIDFVMQLENLPFGEALQRVSDLTGIAPPKRRGGSFERIDPTLADANAAAARWFEDKLSGEGGHHARTYLEKRGVSEEVCRRFRLGFAPQSRDGLKAALLEQGISEKNLIDSGLLATDDDRASFDRFRNRLMFPIVDSRDRIVGFGGRALGDAKAKYLNTPETDLFHKGRLLYGLPLATAAARQEKEIVLVEGYMDVIALADCGIEHAVAPLGTAVTEDQLKLLWRYSDEPLVCLDGDAAGLAAALRTIRRALPVIEPGNSLRFVLLPQGEDPDSLVRGQGVAALRTLIDSALPLSRMIWQAEWAARPPTTPEHFAGLRKSVLEYASLAADDGLRSALRDQFFRLLDEHRPQRPSQRQFSRDTRRDGWTSTGKLGATLLNTMAERERRLLAAFIAYPTLIDDFEDELGDLELRDSALDSLRQELLSAYAETPDLDAAGLRDHLHRYGFEPIVKTVTGGIAVGSPNHLGMHDQDKALELRQIMQQLRHKTATRRVASDIETGLRGAHEDDLSEQRRSLDRLLNSRSEAEGSSEEKSGH